MEPFNLFHSAAVAAAEAYSSPFSYPFRHFMSQRRYEWPTLPSNNPPPSFYGNSTMDHHYHALSTITPSSYSSTYISSPNPYMSNTSSETMMNDIEQSRLYYTDITSRSDDSIDDYDYTLSSATVFSLKDRCQVCSDRSSGIHFGVSTCEACKAFFRRANNNSLHKSCEPKKCIITPQNRNDCPGCRYDKCKRVGMARENVVYGKPSKQKLDELQQQTLLRCTNESDVYPNFNDRLKRLADDLALEYRQIDALYRRGYEQEQLSIHALNYGTKAYKLFYTQRSELNIRLLTDIILKLCDQLLNLYKNGIITQPWFIQQPNLRSLLTLWLFIYYYETFVLKQKVNQDKLMLLIRLLDMELERQTPILTTSIKTVRCDFINTFTKFTELLQEI
ncbi:unnamed protein product [Didymodactylos carnosus]|uniref:Nuclear receptor domain-containing protein n=1 Tax=Didymodactylos carnosus TaxID=1234261 RepID=A0A814Q323_9BILA|nr:unnamed protein product [Didymodactylos carnosus]CAF1113973.1 unnamed protein product [Didymodactylos carnosus]CAF3686983.1 unnamed protein product [Didymodactylos carnosus]CAF3878107.1 unnamed protein product [Didymodactylos carnosus]